MKKTVLITGSSRGIGRSAALAFAAAGYQVVINGASESGALDETKAAVQSLGAPCLAVRADVSTAEGCALLFSRAESCFGSVDVLVNNAGISITGLLQDMTDDQWDLLIRTNLTSVFRCCRLAVPGMIRRQAGKIINVSSVWGEVGASCEAAYSASKGGINALTRGLAKELAPSHIQVNAVALGAIDTDMNGFLNAEEKAALEEEIPAGRMGTAGEAGDLILSIAEAPEYLTGQIIRMDGGWI